VDLLELHLYFGISWGSAPCTLQISYTTAVQDVCLLGDGSTLVVAVRDSHTLRVLKLDALDVSILWQTHCGGCSSTTWQLLGHQR
jgi:hypothetical protein